MNNYIKLWVQLPILCLTMIALTFTGCKDMANSSEDIEPKTLTSVIPTQNSSNVISSNIPDGLLPNSQIYNNSSKPVATGKSGGITLTARAIMNSQMIVDLEVTTGELDSDEEASGTITKVRVKALDTDNPDPDNPVWEENYNTLDDGGSFIESYDNLLHGQQMDIHANVGEMFEDKENSTRLGVVSLLETVKFRPDLAVTNVDAPAEVFVQDPVNIIAEVSENLGDLGATTDCILRIDGNEIDRATGIWVDAGDAVHCSFQTQFGTTGTKNGEVSVENVTPGDFDYGNNSSTFQIEVSESTLNDFFWLASATIDVDDYTISTNYWLYGNNYTQNQIGKRQNLFVSSYTTNPVGFPMDINVNVNSGSHTWLNESLASVNPTTINYYFIRSITYLPNNSSIQVHHYTFLNNNTYITLRRYARNVVYYGYDYWQGDYYYEYNDTMLPYGNDLTFQVTLDGSEGSATLMGEIPLSEYTDSYNYCYSNGCTSRNYHYLYGYATGSPD